MPNRKFSRRAFLKGAGLTGAGLLTMPILNACAPAAQQAAPAAATAASAAAPAAATAASAAAGAAPTVVKALGDKFDWKRFKGEHLELLLIKNTMGDLLSKYHKEFEDLTGITVGADLPAEQQQRQKLTVEFNSGQTSFDVVYYSFHVSKRLFGKNKWVKDIREYLNDPTMTNPDFDWNDFSNAGKAWATEADGRIDALPNKIDYFILYCNQDLFQAKGISYPKTFDEMVAAAKALHDPTKNVYGFAGRGLKNANAPLWTSLMINWGLDPVDEKGNLNTDTPEAIASATLYQNLLKNYGPPGVSGFNWNECQSAFALGQVAMWLDGIGFATPLEDKTKSKVVGKVAYVVPPAGPKTQYAGMTGDGMGISSYSKKQGPAWYYCQWAVGKQMMARSLAVGAGSPPRNSSYTDQEALANLQVPKAWIDCLNESAKIGHPTLPIIIPVTEFRDIFGIALTNMIGGADPAAELKKATADFKPVLEKSEQA